jgi:hypothetical protein
MEYWAKNNGAILKNEMVKDLGSQKINILRHHSTIPAFHRSMFLVTFPILERDRPHLLSASPLDKRSASPFLQQPPDLEGASSPQPSAIG